MSTSVPAPQAAIPASAVKRVQVLGGKSAIEIEVEGSERLVPQTRVLTGPDRLVIDFPNASPSAQLRSQSVNRGEVKDVRVGLFQTTPPVTRLVVDLKSPQSFQIFPNGKTIIIKVNGKDKDKDQNLEKNSAAQGVDDFPEPVTRPGLLTTNYAAGAGNIRAAAAEPVLDVTFRNGLLSIKSTKASLSEILFAVHQRTGADVTLSAGAEQEKVAADIGPAPAPEVLTRLLNGSKFNYLILSSVNDPHVLDKVILSPKAEGAITPLPPMPNSDDMSDDGPPPPPMPQRPEPRGENSPQVENAPPTNQSPSNIPQMNPSLPHAVPPPAGQVPSTPPPDDNSN
ncbi:MAG TPA: AMIN domain-containing protein [Candidatus Sulfotelmatobacter sp.]